MLSNNIHDYHIVAQGKTTIPSVDDNEEMLVTDVSAEQYDFPHLCSNHPLQLNPIARLPALLSYTCLYITVVIM